MEKLLNTQNVNDAKVAFGVAATHPKFSLFYEDTVPVVELDLRTENFSGAYTVLVGQENFKETKEVTDFLDKWKNDLNYPFETCRWVAISNSYRPFVIIVYSAVTTTETIKANNDTGLFLSHVSLKAYGDKLDDQEESQGYLSYFTSFFY